MTRTVNYKPVDFSEAKIVAIYRPDGKVATSW